MLNFPSVSFFLKYHTLWEEITIVESSNCLVNEEISQKFENEVSLM